MSAMQRKPLTSIITFSGFKSRYLRVRVLWGVVGVVVGSVEGESGFGCKVIGLGCRVYGVGLGLGFSVRVRV